MSLASKSNEMQSGHSFTDHKKKEPLSSLFCRHYFDPDQDETGLYLSGSPYYS